MFGGLAWRLNDLHAVYVKASGSRLLVKVQYNGMPQETQRTPTDPQPNSIHEQIIFLA